MYSDLPSLSRTIRSCVCQDGQLGAGPRCECVLTSPTQAEVGGGIPVCSRLDPQGTCNICLYIHECSAPTEMLMATEACRVSLAES